MRTHAELLPAVTAAVRPVLVGMGDAAPSQGAQELPDLQSTFDVSRLLHFSLYSQAPLRGDQLMHPFQLRSDAASSPATQCQPPDADADRDYTWIFALELAWRSTVLHYTPNFNQLDAAVVRGLHTASAAEQQDFLLAYAAAGRSCNYSAMQALYEQWAR